MYLRSLFKLFQWIILVSSLIGLIVSIWVGSRVVGVIFCLVLVSQSAMISKSLQKNMYRDLKRKESKTDVLEKK